MYFVNQKELVKKFDQDLMISVVTNLIDNAVKASRKESKIVLEATPDHLMVQDFGKGIPKEDLEMVTEPFYMVDKSRSRAKGSVGLGLSLCQKIIELHDFQLKIEKQSGKRNYRLCFLVITLTFTYQLQIAKDLV